MNDLTQQLEQLGTQARDAYRVLASLPAAKKSAALMAAAASLRAAQSVILEANAHDMAQATSLSDAMRDRLLLTDARVEAMAVGIEQVAALSDPVGREMDAWDVASNGLHIVRRSVPLGVIGMIYESRPNVTADAAALALKAGNAMILRGGSESFRSNTAIANAMREGLMKGGMPDAAMQLVPTQDRAAVGWMLTAAEYIDVIIPRGGQTLTDRVAKEARVPTLLHLTGNCHMYLHAQADAATAQAVVLNAKMRRTGVCGALESLLVDTKFDTTLLQAIVQQLLQQGCEVRGDVAVQKLDARIVAATKEDWSTEYLAPILSVKMVDGLNEAIAHINRYGSHHTDAIITADDAAAQTFVREVDSAIVLVNASTQFADGSEFGFGAEIGIATGRLHARGPVGAAQLVTYKYVVTTQAKDGAIRAG